MSLNHHFWNTAGENPGGGTTTGIGINISWQHGLVGEEGQTGAFVEDVIEAAIKRLGFYQDSGLANQYNERAIECLEESLEYLKARTKERKQRGVDNSYDP